MIIHLMDIIATVVFAVSGGFHAVKHELDLLGVLVLSTATGIGGGVIRDIIFGTTPPFEWIVAETSKNVGKDKRRWLTKEDIPRGL